MKKILLPLAAVAILSLTGCARDIQAAATLVDSLAKDPNIVHISMVTAQGTLEIDRSGPVGGTNSVTIGGPGGITTK